MATKKKSGAEITSLIGVIPRELYTLREIAEVAEKVHEEYCEDHRIDPDTEKELGHLLDRLKRIEESKEKRRHA